MSDIRPIQHWQSSTAGAVRYEHVLGAIGTEKFGPAVRDAVVALTHAVRRVYLFEATGRHESSLQYYFGEPGLAGLFPAYRKWYLPVDPVCDAYEQAPTFGDVVLQRVRPAHIASSSFRRRIFDDAGIIERVSIIQRGPDSWRVMNVARHASDGRFSDTEIGGLIGLGCLVLPMLTLNREQRVAPAALTVAEMEDRFAARFASLTRRERQVCARAAIGMSVDATAVDLHIARSTVLTFRKRAYQRLNVSSPFELCALVAH